MAIEGQILYKLASSYSGMSCRNNLSSNHRGFTVNALPCKDSRIRLPQHAKRMLTVYVNNESSGETPSCWNPSLFACIIKAQRSLFNEWQNMAENMHLRCQNKIYVMRHDFDISAERQRREQNEHVRIPADFYFP